MARAAPQDGLGSRCRPHLTVLSAGTTLYEAGTIKQSRPSSNYTYESLYLTFQCVHKTCLMQLEQLWSRCKQQFHILVYRSGAACTVHVCTLQGEHLQLLCQCCMLIQRLKKP